MDFKRTLNLIIVIFLVFSPIKAFAEVVTSDGSFEDWTDKPYLAGSSGGGDPTQEIILLRWYPNPKDSMLYFFCERAKGTDGNKIGKFVDWELEVFFDSEGEAKRATIEYHPPSNKVEVKTYDADGNYMWGAKGKWGDDKEIGKRIEFYIPLKYIVGTVQTGYEVNVYFMSENNRFPGSGSITISTVSTFPLYTILGVIITTFLITFFRINSLRRIERG